MTVSNPMKLWKKLLFAAVIIVVAAALYLLISIRSISVEQVSPDLHVLFGVGSNTTVLNTDVGAVVIDSMTFPMQGALIRRMAEELTGKPVVLLINTHYHLDHTHGNPAFQEGTRVVSTETRCLSLAKTRSMQALLPSIGPIYGHWGQNLKLAGFCYLPSNSSKRPM